MAEIKNISYKIDIEADGFATVSKEIEEINRSLSNSGVSAQSTDQFKLAK